jgi:hypothetical protein
VSAFPLWQFPRTPGGRLLSRSRLSHSHLGNSHLGPFPLRQFTRTPVGLPPPVPSPRTSALGLGCAQDCASASVPPRDSTRRPTAASRVPAVGTFSIGPESLLPASAPGLDSSHICARTGWAHPRPLHLRRGWAGLTPVPSSCARTDWAHPRPLHLRRGWTRPIPTSHLRRDHHICARTHSAAPGPRASGIPPSVLVGFLPACKWDSSQRVSGIPPSVLVGFLLAC